MKTYRGVVKGNTVILEEKPDLPDECQALVEIKPVDRTRDEEIARQQIELFADDPVRADKQQRVNAVMDAVNARYGEFALAPAQLLNRSSMPNVIAPAWKPYGHRQFIP